jgi:type II secretory pathway component PulF
MPMLSFSPNMLFRQLSTMLNAGVPIYQALTVLGEQAQPRKSRKCIAALSASVLEGTLLSRAMASCPNYFTPFHVAMVMAGERSGNLVTALGQLADCLDEEQSVRSDIKRELFYPKLVMALVLLFWPFILFSCQNRPVLLVIVGIVPLLTFCLLLLVGAVLPRLSGQSSPWRDYIIARIPILGKTASLIAQTHFARSLSFLYHAGIPLPEAVRWSGDACGNACLTQSLRVAARRLEAGTGFASALSSVGVLDPILITMLKTGELTGSLEVVLEKASEYFQQTTDVTLHQLKASLGIAALLNVGFCVGVIAVGAHT